MANAPCILRERQRQFWQISQWPTFLQPRSHCARWSSPHGRESLQHPKDRTAALWCLSSISE